MPISDKDKALYLRLGILAGFIIVLIFFVIVACSPEKSYISPPKSVREIQIKDFKSSVFVWQDEINGNTCYFWNGQMECVDAD